MTGSFVVSTFLSNSLLVYLLRIIFDELVDDVFNGGFGLDVCVNVQTLHVMQVYNFDFRGFTVDSLDFTPIHFVNIDR